MEDSTILQIIQSCGFCQAEDVKNLQIMKSGMTNHSYSFYFNNKRFIIRIPGEGTGQLINRFQEYNVYCAVSPLDISECVHYFDPVSGIKIASFLENAYTCNKNDWNSVQKCMSALRSFHSKRLYVEHNFDLWERILYYEYLWHGTRSRYPDYTQVKDSIFNLRKYIEAQPRENVLCHIDSIPDNFMFVTHRNSDQTVKLIDWEYAGMQDPHLDIAMFAIYAMYDRNQIDNLIDLYFLGNCNHLTRMKIYCYIAASGLLWSNWCEFKCHCGVEFGVYAQRQYEYAKQYSKIFCEEYREEFGRAYAEIHN